MNKNKYLHLSKDEFGVHQKIIKYARFHKVILEVGCAAGYMSKELAKKGSRVFGIEADPILAASAAKYCEKLICGNIENKKTIDELKDLKFDAIIIADVLEHLREPTSVLKNLVPHLERRGRVYISVPNIVFLTNRLLHLLGRFDYTQLGIMDENHLRFFTKKTILQLIESVGLKVVRFDSVGNFTQLPFYMQTLYPLLGKKRWWRKIEYKVTGFWPEGLAVQFLLICKKR